MFALVYFALCALFSALLGGLLVRRYYKHRLSRHRRLNRYQGRLMHYDSQCYKPFTIEKHSLHRNLSPAAQ
jgi:uncharacterized protein YneF (UPF0154 family)